MSSIVRPVEWHAQPEQIGIQDKLTVRNLEVTVNAGVDVWGRQKQQRALVTVTLSFARSIDSAAEADALDNSTVHYGVLSKNLRSFLVKKSDSWVPTVRLAEMIKENVLETAGKTLIQAVEIGIHYPKGSMLGEGAGLAYSTNVQGSALLSNVLYLQNVQVPCLIGINSNERLHKQPVAVSIWVECLPRRHSDAYPHLETIIVNAVSNSSFETLESLVTMVIQELRDQFFTSEDDDGSYVRLRVEKPHAVHFADAPAIEIVRPARAR